MSYSINEVSDLINGNTPAGIHVERMSHHDRNVYVFTLNNGVSVWFTAYDSAATIRHGLRNKKLLG